LPVRRNKNGEAGGQKKGSIEMVFKKKACVVATGTAATEE